MQMTCGDTPDAQRAQDISFWYCLPKLLLCKCWRHFWKFKLLCPVKKPVCWYSIQGIGSFVGTCGKLFLTFSVHLPTKVLVVVIMTVLGPFSLCHDRPGFICFWWQWVSEQSLCKKTGSVCRTWCQGWVWRHKSEVHHQWPRRFITRTVRECLFFSFCCCGMP